MLPQLTIEKETNYGQTTAPARLILAGLVKTEKFQSEYRAIPPTWLLLFLFFVLLGLLSLPIIHLGSMDYRERLRSIHVFSLLVACVAGTGLITLLFLDLVWLNNVRDNLNEQLKETADGIKEVFKDELEKTLGLLRAYDQSDDFEDDFNCVTQGKDCPVSYFTYPHACAEESNRKCGWGSKEDKDRWVARKEYPYLCNENNKKAFPYHCDYDHVVWVDPDKKARITWTTKPEYYHETSKVSLAHRDYVNRILDPDPKSALWHTKDGHPFYAQSLHSLGTGKHMVILSMESSLSEQEESSKEKSQEPTKWVAAIETKFQFLKSVTIPEDTGFDVIEDEKGRVLFHSDENESLWENFFEETDDDPQLKAHVFSRTDGAFQGTYWGKRYSFYSIPLPHVPWSLVVFRNKELFRTANFEAILLASALFALYIVIFGIVPVAIWLFNKARRRKMSMSWFWPNPDRYDCYYISIGLIFFSFFLGGLLWFSFSNLQDGYAVLFAFLYPPVSLIGLWFLRQNDSKPHQEISPRQLHCRYAFAVISFLLLFSALPMGIFFKAGADREMILAMKYNLITLGEKLLQTPDLDFSQMQREIRGIDKSSFIAECSESECEAVKCEQANSQQEDCPLECPETFISGNNRTLLHHGIHLSPIAETSMYVSDNDPSTDFCSRTELSLLERFHRRIRENSLSRLSNPVSISTLGLLSDQSQGVPFNWRYASPPSIALDFQVPLKQSESQTKWVILRSTPPSDVWSIPCFLAKHPLLGSIVLIVFVPMLVMVPIFIVSRIFPILREPSTNENSNQEKSKENSNQKEGNLLIIGLPESLESYRQENPPSDKRKRIDCHLISDPVEWWKIKRQVLYTKEAGVILDHFEYQFGVPEFDRAKLELLTALLAKGKQICVLSTIDPLKFASDDNLVPSSSDESKSPVPVSLRHWSQVFQSFNLHYHEPETSPDSKSASADEPSYEAIWQARTTDDKITLYHLARDGFVHAENPDLPALFALGLIKPKPALCLVDDGFEDYVLNAAQRDRLDAKEPVKSHPWKWPLAIVLIVLGTGLLLTQKELNNVVVAILSLLPVLLPTLSELIGDSQKDGNAT